GGRGTKELLRGSESRDDGGHRGAADREGPHGRRSSRKRLRTDSATAQIHSREERAAWQRMKQAEASADRERRMRPRNEWRTGSRTPLRAGTSSRRGRSFVAASSTSGAVRSWWTSATRVKAPSPSRNSIAAARYPKSAT